MKYPFTAHQLNRNELVNYLSECIDDQGRGNKKRIRAAIDYAVTKGKIQVKKNDLFDDQEFFPWAVEKWPELRSIENLPLKKHVITGAVAAGPATISGFMAGTSNDINELREQYVESRQEVTRLEDLIKEKDNYIETLESELNGFRLKDERHRQASAKGGRKSRGETKEF